MVAPLDFPAEGVVLVTNDGALGQALAKSRVAMTYHVKLQGMISDNDVDPDPNFRGWSQPVISNLPSGATFTCNAVGATALALVPT